MYLIHVFMCIRDRYNREEAARAILRLRDLDADRPRNVRLAKKSLDGDDRLRLKVYSAAGPLALSDVCLLYTSRCV